MPRMDIEWEAPPAHARVIGSGQRPGRYMEFAEALRQNVGKWAKLPTVHGDKRTKGSANSTAQNIRGGKVKGFEQGKFETAIADTEVWVMCSDAGTPKTPRQMRGDGDDPPDDEEEQPRAPRPPSSDLAPKIRQWAKREGLAVPEHGRLPEKIREAYFEEYPEDKPLRVVN